MRPSRRQFFVFTGSAVAAAPLLVSCSSNDSSNSAAGLATAEGASPSETGAHYGNLSGELLWQRYDSATPVTPSMNPETGGKGRADSPRQTRQLPITRLRTFPSPKKTT